MGRVFLARRARNGPLLSNSRYVYPRPLARPLSVVSPGVIRRSTRTPNTRDARNRPGVRPCRLAHLGREA